ncbi:MAG TPA: hypothetical protein VGI24_06115 [Solirubrobacteraceae bacterium]
MAQNLLVHHAHGPVTAYRIVKDVDLGHPDLLDSFRSNYELGAPPRGLEYESTLIHLGLSMYREVEMAIATALRWPRIGQYVAEVQLKPNNGFCYAATAQRGHLTVWGGHRSSWHVYAISCRLAMHYVLLSSTGNLIDSYDDESKARVALQRIVDGDPENAEDVALMSYGDDGMPVGNPVFAKIPASR